MARPNMKERENKLQRLLTFVPEEYGKTTNAIFLEQDVYSDARWVKNALEILVDRNLVKLEFHGLYRYWSKC